MKPSIKKFLLTLYRGGLVSRRVHQETMQHAVMNNWAEYVSGSGWKLTDKGFDALKRA